MSVSFKLNRYHILLLLMLGTFATITEARETITQKPQSTASLQNELEGLEEMHAHLDEQAVNIRDKMLSLNCSDKKTGECEKLQNRLEHIEQQMHAVGEEINMKNRQLQEQSNQQNNQKEIIREQHQQPSGREKSRK